MSAFVAFHTRDEAQLVFYAIEREREVQDERWGEQNHPNGTGELYAKLATWIREQCSWNAAVGTITWADILKEEVYEAFAEADPARLKVELIQVAAVATAWVEAIERAAAR